MLTLVLGPSGSGKTNWLIQKANEDMKSGHGNIAFIDSDDSHIFTLDHAVRLINAHNYKVSNVDRLYGFLAGIISRDYDLEKIYVDGIYGIVDVHRNLEELIQALHDLSDVNNADILMGLDLEEKDLPTGVEYKIIVLSAK